MFTPIIEQFKIDQFSKWLKDSKQITLISHVGPDGDAIGSTLGLSHYLMSLGKETTIIVPNAFPEFLLWMPGAEDVLIYDQEQDKADELLAKSDIICCLDFNGIKRVDKMSDALAQSSARKIMIDHHLHPEDFCSIVMSYPRISSTSEIVFRLIYQMRGFDSMTKQAAECIYTGMMTDTGGFTYNSNNSEIYFIISELLSKGIDKDDIYRKVFNTYSESRLRLMGYLLYSKMKVYPAHHAAMISLTQKEAKEFNYVKGDSEGFVNIPLTVKGVKFSAFFREDIDLIKVSLRSVGDFPCNKLAAEFFGGGGHLNASGGEFYGTMEQAIETLERAIDKYEPLLTAKK